MKRHHLLLIVGLLTGLSTLMVHGQVSVSADIQAGPVNVQINSPSDFTQPLSPYGRWVDVERYGHCWHPTGVTPDWQPYANGQWVWTDAGWYWQSDEPWGWATCHYGSWIDDPTYGWCWIPGTQWAPAWVTWRQSDDYIGWAPCGPNQTVLAPSFFLFTGVHDFGRAFRGRGDFIRDNPTIIDRTRVINDFSTRTVNFDGRERRISYNRGPAVESVQRATGRTFQARPVQDIIREQHQPSNLRENRQQHEEPNRLEQERPNREQQPGNPQSYQPTPNRSTRPGPQPATPEQRQIQPTGREHGISTPPQQREVPNPAQPRTPNPSERPTPQPSAPPQRQLQPTGQEHGTSFPPQQRETAHPAQANPKAEQQPAPRQEKAPQQDQRNNQDGKNQGNQ